MKSLLAFFLFILAISTSIACSNGSNPLIPPADNSLEPVKVSAGDYKTDTRGVIGAWKVHVNTQNMTAEIIPARNVQAIGHIFDADLSQFLTKSPCSNCLRIPHIELDGYNDLAIDISMRHPFSNITSRPDLHGFDTRAIIIMETDTMLTYPDIDITMPDGITEGAVIPAVDHGVLNADGYTSHYDELVTDPRYFMGGVDQAGNLNPFLRFFEDPTTGEFDPHSPTGHNVMQVGSDINTRTAIFDLDIGNTGLAFDFYIVADVAYGQSSTFQNRTDPQYYLPWFNRTEAWRVEYWFENHNLTEEVGTTTDLVVQVFDWQNGFEVDPNYPDPANLDGIPQSSDVLSVELSIPEFQAGIITGTYESGTGSPDDPLQYRLTITNEEEFYYDSYGLLAIRDTLNGHAFPDGRMGIPASPAGFPYETLDIRDYTLYQYVHVNNEYENHFLDDLNSWGEFEFFLTSASQFAPEDSGISNAQIFATHHMDPSHTKFSYAWDYNYNGSYFTPDGSGMPSPVIPYAKPGRHDVVCRISTNSVPPQEFRYDFPVYAEGEIYNDNMFLTGDLKYATSSMRGNSAYVGENGFWLAYQQNESDLVDIWLAVGDKSGTITKHRITNSSDGAWSPALTVIEEGPNQGVYIVYCAIDTGGIFVYSIHGNLDGTGFDAANIRRVSSAGSAIEIDPGILFRSNNFHVYYLKYSLVNGYIYGSHSDDAADTWNDDGWVVDNGSSKQNTPVTVKGNNGGIHLVWSDFLESSTRGSDIWYASSSDGITFYEPNNISTLRGEINEMTPDCDVYDGTLFCAYVAQEASSPDTTLYLKVCELYDNTTLDYIVDYPNVPKIHSAPGISVNGESIIIIGYATQFTDSDSQTFKVNKLKPTGFGSFWVEDSLIYLHDLYATSLLSVQLNPVIVSDLPVEYGIDALVAWTDPTGGLDEYSGTNYGNMSVAEYILTSGAKD